MSSTDPDTLELLVSVGESIANNVSRLAAQTLFYGMFIMMFVYSTILFLRHQPPSRIMFVVYILAFAGATAHWGGTVAFDMLQIRWLLIHNLDLDVSTRISIMAAKAYGPDLVQQWTGMLLPLLSDAVLIWRAWTLYNRKLWLVPAVVPLVACVGTTLAFLALITNYDNWLNFASGGDSPVLTKLQTSTYILSFCTNLIAMSLIAWILWTHRQFLRQMMGKDHTRQTVERTLALLVESGFVYCVFQLVLVALALAPSPKEQINYYMAALFLSVYTQLSAMYPVAIVILVRLQVSISDTPGVSTLGFSDSTPQTFASSAANASKQQQISLRQLSGTESTDNDDPGKDQRHSLAGTSDMAPV